MTLPREGQDTTHPSIRRQHIVYRDETKVLIAWGHTVHRCLTTRSDDEEILDEFLSKMDEIEKDSDEAAAETKRRADEAHVTTWSSLAELCQCVKMWKEGCSHRDAEACHSWDGQLWTCHTSDDGPGTSHLRSLHTTREGCEQDGHCPSEEPNNRSHRLSPLNIQRHTVWMGRHQLML